MTRMKDTRVNVEMADHALSGPGTAKTFLMKANKGKQNRRKF